jgi:cystathionine beta-lyase/cystathionine gamma-synthase
MEKKMKLETRAVHAGDRKRPANRDAFVPVATPIYASSSFLYADTAKLDRVLGHEEEGYSYARYENPTRSALEETLTNLEGGAGAVACSSGMMAMELALQAALMDRPKAILAANALYGATLSLLTKVLEPMGVETDFVDICDFDAVRAKLASRRYACVTMETISNPLLRVGEIDRIAAAAREQGALLVVDNTFATPMLARPLELGATYSVHSVTKFLAGHGDVLGGAVISDAEGLPALTALSRITGPVLGPFESYLTMRGIKTFPLRMERQCANACRVAAWLQSHPRIEKVHYCGDPAHPDAGAIRRLLPEGLRGALVSFSIAGAGRAEVFRFMDRLELVVRGTSLGDVHTLVLYPAIASHRDLAPKQRARLGIGDGLVRLSLGIEAVDDLIADLDQALAG